MLTSQTLFSYGFYGTKLKTFVIYSMTSAFLFIDQQAGICTIMAIAHACTI